MAAYLVLCVQTGLSRFFRYSRHQFWCTAGPAKRFSRAASLFSAYAHRTHEKARRAGNPFTRIVYRSYAFQDAPATQERWNVTNGNRKLWTKHCRPPSNITNNAQNRIYNIIHVLHNSPCACIKKILYIYIISIYIYYIYIYMHSIRKSTT